MHHRNRFPHSRIHVIHNARSPLCHFVDKIEQRASRIISSTKWHHSFYHHSLNMSLSFFQILIRLKGGSSPLSFHINFIVFYYKKPTKKMVSKIVKLQLRFTRNKSFLIRAHLCHFVEWATVFAAVCRFSR